jgi:DNA-binding response OmpR family regulator
MGCVATRHIRNRAKLLIVGDALMSNARVLVAEDNDNFRDLLTQLLKHEGYEVEAVTNGDDLVRVAGERPSDVILADVRLPGLATLEALRRLKRSNGKSAVILMTGASDDETRREAAELGVVFMLEKPFGFDTLRNAMRACARPS